MKRTPQELAVTRRHQLRKLVANLGGVKEFAEYVELDPSYISNMTHRGTRHRIGDKAARQLEEKVDVERGYLDGYYWNEPKEVAVQPAPAPASVSADPTFAERLARIERHLGIAVGAA